MKKLIISPSYNERENIENLVRAVFQNVDQQTDLLIVDDSSPDGTAEIVKKLKSEFPNLYLKERSGKLGLASAYLDTIRDSLEYYDAIMTMDADLSHPVEKIGEMFDALEDHDFSIGSRYIKGGSVKNWPFRRVFLSYFGNIYVRSVLMTGIADSSAGFMAMKTSMLKSINIAAIDSQGYSFLSELKYILKSLKYKHKEIPICFTDRVFGDSKISNNIIIEGLIMPIVLRCKSKKRFRKIYNCDACHNEMYYSFSKNEYDLYTCQKCKTISVKPQVSNEVLEDYYAEGYFRAEGDKVSKKLSYNDYSNTINFKSRLYDTILKHVADKQSILDVGCAYGDFVRYAQEKNKAAFGIDISKEAANTGKGNGLSIESSSIENYAQSSNRQYAAITMLDLFEHVNDPNKVLESAGKLMEEGGNLIIITPNTESIAKRILGKRWYAFDPPQHLNYFNPDSVKKILKKNGFRVEVIEKIKKEFSLSYFLHIFSVWTKMYFIQRLIPKFCDNIIIKYPIRDNMLISAIKITNNK